MIRKESPTFEAIPMRLTCPECGGLHIDEGEFATRPHHTHACQECGAVWRPAIVPTVGVRFLPGFKNGARVFAELVERETAAANAYADKQDEQLMTGLYRSNSADPQRTICHQIIEERRRQDKQWGGKTHDDYHNRSEWCGFVADHLDRAKKAQAKFVKVGGNTNADEYRKQMIEIAALAMAAIEAHDRRGSRASSNGG